MRISFGTAVSVWLVVAAVLTGCADSGGSGKGGGLKSVVWPTSEQAKAQALAQDIGQICQELPT